MDPLDVLAKFYDRNSKAFKVLVEHGNQVASKALSAARSVAHLDPDLGFIRNAALLHDIGIMHTDSPGFDCKGKYPYICHGLLGREMLDSIGLPTYGLVSERHVGVGIGSNEIRRYKLPLPDRDMLPVSIEEQIICYADKFFSKNGNGLKQNGEKSIDEIIRTLTAYGEDKVQRFMTWMKMFGA